MDPNFTRRRFLETSAALLGVSLVGCGSQAPAVPQSRANADGSVTLTGMQPLTSGTAQPFAFPNGDPGLVYMTTAGQSGAVSAKCTHSGCTVEWNVPNDPKIPLRCPCHESHFALDGKVLGGPAKGPLAHYSVKETTEEITLKAL